MNLELIAPLQRGYHRMVDLLFRPFDAGTWFVLGFTAWLSTFGEGGGFSSSGDIGNLADSDMEGAGEVFREHAALILSIIVVVVIVSVVIALVMLWLRGRGEFMFLSNVVWKRAEIKNPWRDFRQEGNSFFLWLFAYGLVGLLVALVIIGLGVLIALPSIQQQAFGASAIVGISISVLLLLVQSVVFGYISAFLEDFILPLMFLRRCRTNAAWREFLPLFKAQTGALLLYGLFRFALLMVLSMVIMMLVILTCCCAAFLLAIPYLNAVLMLPLTVWWRTFSMEYFRQLGPEFDVWNVPPPAPQESLHQVAAAPAAPEDLGSWDDNQA